MARFNAWTNERIYGCVAELSDEAYRKDRKAFFGSIHNTLNHLLVVDRLWIARAEGGETGIKSLDEILYGDFAALHAARQAEDARLIAFVERFDDAALERSINFRLMTGSEGSMPLDLILMTLFNHQTHHRGQVPAMLTQDDIFAPPLDIPYFLAEQR